MDIFVSSWHYYKLQNRYKNMTLDEFALMDHEYTKRKMKDGLIGPNQLLTDFNLGPEDVYNDEAVREIIEQVERVFQLVMFVEHFEVP